MAVESFMVPLVERNRLPLVSRRSGVREYQQKEKDQYGHSESNHKEEKKSKDRPSKLFGCLISGNQIDCRV